VIGDGQRLRGAAIGCLLVGLLGTAALSGCDGSKHQVTASGAGRVSATGSSTATGGASADPATTAAVSAAFTTFFDGSAAVSTRLTFLQNAEIFEQALAAQSSSPLISQTSVTLSRVSLTTATQATVIYTVFLSGKQLLADQTGTAVEINGGWKVAAATFCALLTLGGQAPAACAQASTTALPS
jgi:hypothetical protein